MLLTYPTNKVQSKSGILENYPFDVLTMTGNESVDFLQRISTNDFGMFKSGDIQKTLFISEKGRVIDIVWVIHQTSHLLLLLSSGMAKEVSDWLNKYIIMEDIVIEDVSSQYAVDIHFDEFIENGFRTDYFGFSACFVMKKKSANKSAPSSLLSPALVKRDAQSFELWRIENGIPSIKKELVQDYNPLELNLWDWISFTKGCYIGQEVVARLDTYNKIQRILCKINSEQPIAEGNICLDSDGNEAGKITSVVQSKDGFTGLAVVRMKFAIENSRFRVKNSNTEIVLEKVFQRRMEEINVSALTKSEQYVELLPQIFALVNDESNLVANMANIAAALKQTFDFYSWVGFYLFDSKSNELVLGPFQGKIACTRIGIGKGVCGTSFQRKETIIVPDVDKFPGHIYCDGGSKSEIVVPIFNEENGIGVLDIDSHSYNSFDETDKKYLELLLSQIVRKIIA